MTPKQLEAKRLRDEGLTYQKISHKLGISLSAAWSRLHRGKRNEWDKKFRKTQKYKDYENSSKRKKYKVAWQKKYDERHRDHNREYQRLYILKKKNDPSTILNPKNA